MPSTKKKKTHILPLIKRPMVSGLVEFLVGNLFCKPLMIFVRTQRNLCHAQELKHKHLLIRLRFYLM